LHAQPKGCKIRVSKSELDARACGLGVANTTLSPVIVQRFSALQGDLISLAEQDYTGLTPKLEQIIGAFKFTQIEFAVYRDRGYAQGRGVGQPEADRCALACAFLAKAVLDLKTTRALIDRLQAHSKLR
jgi:hypothetical protein